MTLPNPKAISSATEYFCLRLKSVMSPKTAIVIRIAD